MAVEQLKKEDLAAFPEIALEFQRTMSGVYGRSNMTVFEYMLDLRLFLRYLAAKDAGLDPAFDDISEVVFSGINEERLRDVTSRDIIAYLYYLTQTKHNSPVTRNRKLSCLRSFFKFLKRTGRIEANPTEQIEGPKKRTTLPKFLSLDQSIDLLQIVNESTSKSKKRDYAILTLFLNCGMRLSELTGINLTDIAQDFSSLRVLGKGNKERIVYLNDSCRDAINAYRPVRKIVAGPDCKAFFVSSRRKRMSRDAVHAMVKKTLLKAGLDASLYSSHKLRHTAATLMLQNGVDVRTVQEVLGHTNLNTTQIYTHVDNSELHIAAEANPLSHFKPAADQTDSEYNKT